MVDFTGERIVPEADNCEPLFADKMYQEHIARYAFASQWIKGKRVLDVGCGVGYGSRWLAENGASSVCAIDISDAALEHANKHYAHKNITYIQASASDFSFEERFDVVTCFELIEHVDAQREVIQRIRQSLEDDGILLISTPRALEKKRTHFHTQEFSESQFRELLESKFPEVKFYFENNHFSSFISDGSPRSITNVLALKDQYSLSQADYFIAVASLSSSRKPSKKAKPILVMNNDKYVRLLENDVEVLHKAEDGLLERLNEREDELKKNSETNTSLRKEIDELAKIKCEFIERCEKDAVSINSLQEEVKELSKARDELLSQHEKDVGKVINMQEEIINLSKARDELLSQHEKGVGKVINMQEEIINLSKARDELQSRHGKVMSEINSLQEESKGTKEMIKQQDRYIDTLINEINYLQSVISEIKASNSWKLTAPYRLVGDCLLYPIRLLRKAHKYRQMYGTRALLGAVRRRLTKKNATIVVEPNAEVGFDGNKAESPGNSFDVVFAIGCWEGESKRYRVYNIAEGLELIGYKVHVIPFSEIAGLANNDIKADVVVLFRAPYDLEVGIDKFLKYAKERNIKVVFDVDDLVFNPEIIDQVDGFRLLSDSEKHQYINGVHLYREMLLASDIVTVPTEYLCECVRELGKEVAVIPNSINKAQQDIAEVIRSQPQSVRDFVRIGYFSGSYTHQADFAQCSDALYQLMKSDPRVVLRIVGFLDLEERWQALSDRIERFDFQPYLDMLKVLSECDINIAPLELDSVFCHGKSELKLFEAGMLEIPTIASATSTFSKAIKNGVDGFAVSTHQEWLDVLRELVSSSDHRKSIGSKARQTSMEHFAIQRVAQIARDIYGLSLPRQCLKAKDGGTDSDTATRNDIDLSLLRISWVIPGLIIGGGGHRNILRAAYFLTQFGHKVSLYFTGTEKSPKTLKREIQENFYPLDCPVYLYEGEIHPADVVFATHWSTVNAALSARGVAKEIMYFVQDFEPAFAPMGAEYVLAENTYRLGLYHITSGPWCEVLLKRDFGVDADHFQFPVDRSIYYPRERSKTNRNLIFFAKPEMPRRCFELGVMALREFHRICPDVEIVMFGSKHASKQKYDFPVTVREVLPTLDDLASMYSNGDIGMVFSTTNPSLIPYEMMACGLPVLDLNRGDNSVNYAGRHDIALLANPQPEIMAAEIANLVNDPAELASRRDNGLAFIETFPSEEGMARRIEDLIKKRVEARNLKGV